MKKLKKSTKLKKKTVKKKLSKPARKKVPYIQKGYHSIIPYLIIDGCDDAIQFYKKAFGAKELFRMEKPDGKISHAELKIGDAKIMLCDTCPEMNAYSPEKYDGSPVGIHLYIKKVDDVVKKAIKLGAKLERSVETMFYGDRSGTLKDPFGHTWYVSTHVENVTPAQVKKRAKELFFGDKKIE